MKPVSPIIKGYEDHEVVYARNQPQYLPLPVLPIEDSLLSRWKLSWSERIAVLFGRDLYLYVTTFGQPLQPLLPTFENRAGIAYEEDERGGFVE